MRCFLGGEVVEAGSLRSQRVIARSTVMPMKDMVELDPSVRGLVLEAAGAESITAIDTVQRLWSGYGQIIRCHLGGADAPSVIVKHVRWPDHRDHPRGWTTDRSHQRKVRSYRVEASWYEHHADRCPTTSRVPTGLAHQQGTDGMVLVMEDLDAAGFDGRRHRVGPAELDACLAWLAGFHATFLGDSPSGLWPVGTYWHLDTRPDEFDVMPDGPLKAAAAGLDRRLRHARFRTVVHGDAKLANFCFAESTRRVAAVDFQYVGAGCGVQDLAYFISSCFDDEECERLAPDILDRYFALLSDELRVLGRSVDSAALETEWRELYPIAWADFARFLQGWSPGHHKLHRYSERLACEAVATLIDREKQ